MRQFLRRLFRQHNWRDENVEHYGLTTVTSQRCPGCGVRRQVTTHPGQKTRISVAFERKQCHGKLYEKAA